MAELESNLNHLKFFIKESLVDKQGRITINEDSMYTLLDLAFNRGQAKGLDEAREVMNKVLK